MSEADHAPPAQEEEVCEQQQQEEEEDKETEVRPPRSYRYTCRMCRGLLFTDADLVPHEPPSDSTKQKGFKYRRGIADDGEASACTSYFLDPDSSPWVAEESRAGGSGSGAEVAPDTIYCPKCSAKVGTQSWTGTQCSCGTWVVPAFKIMHKSVDKMPVFS